MKILLVAFTALLAIGLAAALAWVVATLEPGSSGLRQAVAEHLSQSGVSHPVTAVLLNFRAYDTLLELAVLVLALLGILAAGVVPGRGSHAGPKPGSPLGDPMNPATPDGRALQNAAADATGPVLQTFVQLVAPMMVLLAAYLLWIGATAPGGAFQAGAVLGATGGLLVLVRVLEPTMLTTWGVRVTVIGGVGVFILVGIWPMVSGNAFLEYPPGLAKWLILLIEVAATLSIAAILAGMVGAVMPGDGGDASTAAGRNTTDEEEPKP